MTHALEVQSSASNTTYGKTSPLVLSLPREVEGWQRCVCMYVCMYAKVIKYPHVAPSISRRHPFPSVTVVSVVLASSRVFGAVIHL